MKNVTQKNQAFSNNLAICALSGAMGGAIAIVTQPPYVLKVKKQQASNNIGYLTLSKRILEQRGIVGFWDAITFSLLKSSLKQGIKGGIYSGIDDTLFPHWAKSLTAALAITFFLTPFDRTVNACIANKSKTTSSFAIIKALYTQGPASFLRGWKVDGIKNLVEASLIYFTREYTKLFKTKVKGNSKEALNIAEWLTMVTSATAIKLVSTNFLDVSKSEIQKSLKNNGANLTLAQVLQAKGAKHFFFAGLFMRFVMNFSGMLANFGALEINDLLKKKLNN